MSDPLVIVGGFMLALAVALLVVAVVLGGINASRWLYWRGVAVRAARRRRAAADEQAAIRKKRELAVARTQRDAALLELAAANEYVLVLERALARKERMRRIYWNRLKRYERTWA